MRFKRCVLYLACVFCIVGCGKTSVLQSDYEAVVEEKENYKKLYEDSLEQIKEMEERIDSLEEAASMKIDVDYDYKTDPNTLVVTLSPENISEYIGLVVVQRENGKYAVETHSNLYDQGYVLVGSYYVDLTLDNGWADDTGKCSISSQIYSTDMAFANVVAYGFITYEQAQVYADKGVMFFNPTLKYTDSTLYFQKKEYVGDNYLMEDGRRIVYGDELRCDSFYCSNSF